MISVSEGISTKSTLREDGIDICVSDEQFLKAEFLIKDTDEGTEICFNDEQF